VFVLALLTLIATVSAVLIGVRALVVARRALKVARQELTKVGQTELRVFRLETLRRVSEVIEAMRLDEDISSLMRLANEISMLPLNFLPTARCSLGIAAPQEAKAAWAEVRGQPHNVILSRVVSSTRTELRDAIEITLDRPRGSLSLPMEWS
jgi:hypothetical protein